MTPLFEQHAEVEILDVAFRDLGSATDLTWP